MVLKLLHNSKLLSLFSD